MKASILMANYNNGKYIADAIESVINQSYKDWEIILVDDKSTDDSVPIMSKYISKYPEKIKLFKNDLNMGCGYTKKKCIDNATGEILGFLDPDDTITEDALELMMEHHENMPNHSLIYTTHFICDELLNIIKLADYVGTIPPGETQATYEGPKISAFATFKKEAYGRTPGLDPLLKRAVDQDLYHKLEEVGKCFFVNKPCYLYRHNMNSISLNHNNIKALYWNLVVLKSTYMRRKKLKSPFAKKVSKSKVNQYYFTYFSYKAGQKAAEKQWKKMCYCICKILPLFFLDKELFILRLLWFRFKNLMTKS